DTLERGELIANLCGALELEACTRLLHPCLQLRVDLFTAPLEHLYRSGHILGIGRARNQSHARRRAAADLMLQAGAAAIGKEAVTAIAAADTLLLALEPLATRS